MMPGIEACDAALFSASTGGGGGGGGGSGALDSQTVYCGIYGSTVDRDREVGYLQAVMGSASPGTSALYSGAAINGIYSSFQSDINSYNVILQIAGTLANSGWTTMVVGGSFVLYRTNASFVTSGGNSTWQWSGVGNPFPGRTITDVSFY